VGGAVLAALLVVIGTTTAIVGAAEGRGPLGVPPLAFLAVPLFDMVVFTGLAATGLWYRRRADVHKRLLTLATSHCSPPRSLGCPLAPRWSGSSAFLPWPTFS
jgi:hypothetical protein